MFWILCMYNVNHVHFAKQMKLEAFVKSSTTSSSSPSPPSSLSSIQSSALTIPVQKAPVTPLAQTLQQQGPLHVVTASPWSHLIDSQSLPLSSWSTSSQWPSSPWWSTPTYTWWSTPMSQSWWSPLTSTSWWWCYYVDGGTCGQAYGDHRSMWSTEIVNSRNHYIIVIINAIQLYSF